MLDIHFNRSVDTPEGLLRECAQKDAESKILAD